MTREEVKKMLPVLQAYAAGKEIQWSLKGSNNWYNLDENDIRLSIPCIYRIKPNLQYQPFKSKEEFWNEVKKHEPMLWIQEKEKIDDTQFQITRVNNDGFYSPSSGEISFLKAAVDYEFLDGTPFGIKEEE